MLWAAWFCACTPLVSHLFLTVGALGHMMLHLSSPSLPHLSLGCPPFDSHCLEVRCGCSGPHESTLVSSAVGALSKSPSPGLCAGSTVSKLAAWFSAFVERCGCLRPPDSRLISHTWKGLLSIPLLPFYMSISCLVPIAAAALGGLVLQERLGKVLSAIVLPWAFFFFSLPVLAAVGREPLKDNGGLFLSPLAAITF